MQQVTSARFGISSWISHCSGAETKSCDSNKPCARVQVGAEYLKKTLVQYKPNDPKFYVIYQVRAPAGSCPKLPVSGSATCAPCCTVSRHLLGACSYCIPYVCHPTPLGAGISHAARRACQLCSATDTPSLLLYYRSAT